MDCNLRCAVWTLVLAFAITTTRVTSSPTPLGGWQQGTASFFGGPDGSSTSAPRSNVLTTIPSGSCGYGDLDTRLYPFFDVVGIHPTNKLVKDRAQSACGSCLEIQCTSPGKTCNNATTTLPVVITDQCDQDCNATNINMHVMSFNKLARLETGRIDIRYRLVTCEPADPIVVHIQNYRTTEGGWLRLSLKNVAGDAAVTAVELAPAGSDYNLAPKVQDHNSPWFNMNNTFGGMWEASNFPPPPLDMRVSDSVGELIVIKNAIATEGMLGDVETDAVPQLPVAASTVPEAGGRRSLTGRLVVGAGKPQPQQVAQAAKRHQTALEKAALARVAQVTSQSADMQQLLNGRRMLRHA